MGHADAKAHMQGPEDHGGPLCEACNGKVHMQGPEDQYGACRCQGTCSLLRSTVWGVCMTRNTHRDQKICGSLISVFTLWVSPGRRAEICSVPATPLPTEASLGPSPSPSDYLNGG